jgi:hypothetical protein
MSIQIDPEFKALIPPLAPDEFSQLEANIKAEGCRDPLVIANIKPENHKCYREDSITAKQDAKCVVFFDDGEWLCNRCNYGIHNPTQDVLIDGHNRHEICTRHGIEFKVVFREFPDRTAAMLWMIDNQKGRRNLTDGWKFELAQSKKAILAEKGRGNMRAGGGDQKSGLSTIDRPDIKPIDTRSEIATDLGWSTGKVAMADKVWKQAPEKVKEKVKSGEMSINQAYQRVRHEEKQEKKLNREATRETKREEIANAMPDDVMDVRHCSMEELISSGAKFDCVISDPPYPKEFVGLYGKLAELCANSGVKRVAVMAGQSYLPQIFREMSEHLPYRWVIAYITPGGQAVQQWQAKVNTFWKPILVFGESDDWIGDVAESKPNHNDKRFHHWGQSESGMFDLVKRLARPGETICDPFLGAGTTGVAALANGCKILGCDINADFVEKSKQRIESQWKAMQ